VSCPIGARTGECPVTGRQLEVLQIIERSLEARGFPPTYAEFTVELGLSPHSRQVIHEHLLRLAAKGMLVRHARAARGITLTTAARELLARERVKQGESQCHRVSTPNAS
jgi:SOS-response transcriptional repressor LexA